MTEEELIRQLITRRDTAREATLREQPWSSLLDTAPTFADGELTGAGLLAPQMTIETFGMRWALDQLLSTDPQETSREWAAILGNDDVFIAAVAASALRHLSMIMLRHVDPQIVEAACEIWEHRIGGSQ